MSDAPDNASSPKRQTVHQVFLRGLAISLPAILTILILLWILDGINEYIILPTTDLVKWTIANVVDRSVDLNHKQLVELNNGPVLPYCGENYVVAERMQQAFGDLRKRELSKAEHDKQGRILELTPIDAMNRYQNALALATAWFEVQAYDQDYDPTRDPPFDVYVPLDDRAVPYADYAIIAADTPPGAMPRSATGLYMEYAVRRYVGSAFTLSAFALSLVIVAIYFLGRFVSVRIGSWFVSQVENRLLGRLPVIRSVYGSAKQVTDFLFSEPQVEYRRVVAVEYPRRGIWSLGLVTGEGMLDITAAVGEPCVSILIPSSPMPVTGYTMCIPRSAVLDLNLTVDQAFQFCISCGVLVPGHQKVTPEILQRELARRLAERMQDNATDRRSLSLPSARSMGEELDEDPP